MKTRISIDPVELNSLLEAHRMTAVIDVRTETEFREQHIPFAIHLPVESIESGRLNFDTGILIVTVCGKGGGRSERAARFIREQYGMEAYYLEGGTIGWFAQQNR